MSDPLRVAVVAEGPTDHVMLERIVRRYVGTAAMEYTALQPELSAAFAPVDSNLGFGWGGVYRWAQGVRDEGLGSIRGSYLLHAYDVIIVQVDCDVATARYSDIAVVDPADDLPCAKACPPIGPTLEALGKVILRWLGENEAPAPLVLCLPAQALEGWLLRALYPDDAVSKANRTDCLHSPANRLSAKPLQGRLVSAAKKNLPAYRDRADEFADMWQTVVAACESAAKFDARLSVFLKPL